MRGATATALSMLAAAAPSAFGGPPAHHAGSCVGTGARVLARDGSIGVYEPRPRSGSEPRPIWACVVGHTGHMTLLAPTRLNRHISLDRFELAGHVAAYLETQFGVDSGTTKLVVVDVGARRVLHSIESGSYVDAGLIFSEAVIRFYVTSRGSVAWTVAREDRRHPATASVYSASRAGPPVSLDTGPSVDAGSLALSGATLSWTDGGFRRTAPMP